SLGMRYMTKAGYNPHGQLEVMQVLDREAAAGNTPELLSTHPLPKTRIDRVQKELQTTYANTQSGADAKKYQDFADRYQQRYLSIRSIETNTPGTKKTKKAKQSALPVDENGRTRLLAAVNLDDPTTWCAICAARAAAEAAQR